MAMPPLEHQVLVAGEIILARTAGARSALVQYKVVQHLKPPNSNARGSVLELSVNMFSRLGYVPMPGQEVILFFSSKDVFELLPLDSKGFLHYGLTDPSIRTVMSLEEFKKFVQGH